MKKNLITAVLMTLATTILLGVLYPLMITAFAQLLFHDKANGQLLEVNGKIVGSRIIGQAFTGDKYFHSRPSAAGYGYQADNSNGSQLGPTNRQLIERVKADTATLQAGNPNVPVPIDLVTTSASGLDPEISPAAAAFQIPRVARARGINPDELNRILERHTRGRQFGVLGEARVNVLELNLDLDGQNPSTR
jgi:K+-transporting ATPase ATPase C chain